MDEIRKAAENNPRFERDRGGFHDGYPGGRLSYFIA
jgi:hypothetical protein